MQVVALKPGYYDSLRAVGDIFEVPAGVTGSWFLPTKAEQGARKAQEPQEVPSDPGAAAAATATKGGKPRNKKADADEPA